MSASRTRKSARNAAFSLVTQGALLLLGLVGRAVFVRELGVEFVGIDSLLVSTLTILMVADLGLSAAVMAAMYKPLADGDDARVASLMLFLRTMYRYVALAVLIAGSVCAMILPELANTRAPVPHLRLYFLVLLLGVVGNYLLSYRMNVLVADQRSYVTSAYTLGFQSARQVLQIAALIFFHSYLLYVAIFAVGRFVNALAIHRYTGRAYPFLRRHAAAVSADERRELFRSVRALVVYRASGVVLNNMTPVFVVTMLGATLGGYYGNYMLLVGAGATLLEAVFLSITASVGHLVATSTPESARKIFDELTLVAAILFGIPAVVLATSLTDILTLWLGPQHTLGTGEELAMVGSFLVYGLTMPVLVFRTGTGLFRDAKWVLLFTAGLNVILIQGLGHWLGLFGILAAAPVARLLGNYWMEPVLLMRRHIAGGMLRFWLRHFAIYAAVAASTALISLLRLENVERLEVRVVLEVVAAVAVTGGVLVACFISTSEFSSLFARTRTLLPRLRSSRH